MFSPAGRPLPTVAPATTVKIAFVRFEDDGPRLYLMGPKGAHQIPLFSDGRSGSEPSWSTDGRKIAYKTLSQDGTTAIHIADLERRSVRTVVRQSISPPAQISVSHPAWAPGAERLVFSRTSSQPWEQELFLVGPDGRGRRKLADGIFGAWSPDGREIAFVRYRNQGGTAELFAINASGTGRRLLASRASEPDWSPDGRRIAFTRQHDSQFEIYTMRADGSGERRLTYASAHDINPAWSPDGRQIAFSSRRDGGWEIYVMSSTGSNQTRLTRNLVDEQEPAWRASVTRR